MICLNQNEIPYIYVRYRVGSVHFRTEIRTKIDLFWIDYDKFKQGYQYEEKGFSPGSNHYIIDAPRYSTSNASNYR